MHAGPLQKCVTLKDVVCEVQSKLAQLDEGSLLVTIPISQIVLPTDSSRRNEIVQFHARWATLLEQWKQDVANQRVDDASSFMPVQKAPRTR